MKRLRSNTSKNVFKAASVDVLGWILSFIDTWELVQRTQFVCTDFHAIVQSGRAFQCVTRMYGNEKKELNKFIQRHGIHIRRIALYELEDWILKACPNLEQVEFVLSSRAVGDKLMQYVTNRRRPLSIKTAYHFDFDLTTAVTKEDDVAFAFGPRLHCGAFIANDPRRHLSGIKRLLVHGPDDDRDNVQLTKTIESVATIVRQGTLEAVTLCNGLLGPYSPVQKQDLSIALACGGQTLRHLGLRSCHLFEPGELLPLLHKHCPNLTSLSLVGFVCASQSDMAQLSLLPCLQRLYLERLYFEDVTGMVQHKNRHLDFRCLTNRLSRFKLVLGNKAPLPIHLLPPRAARIELDGAFDVDVDQQPICFPECKELKGGNHPMPRRRRWTSARVTKLVQSFPNLQHLEFADGLSPIVAIHLVDQGHFPSSLTSLECRLLFKTEREQKLIQSISQTSKRPCRTLVRLSLCPDQLDFVHHKSMSILDTIVLLTPLLQGRFPCLEELVIRNVELTSLVQDQLVAIFCTGPFSNVRFRSF